MPDVAIFAETDLAEDEVKLWSAPGPDQARSIIVARFAGGIVAYENICPHQNAPLDAGGGRIRRKRDHLFCAFHSATFEVATGECIWGPCLGKGLTAIPVAIKDGRIILHLPPL